MVEKELDLAESLYQTAFDAEKFVHSSSYRSTADCLLRLLPKIAELENEQNKWISVYDRLPSSYEAVLTYSPELGYREGEWLEIELSWFTNM